MNIGLAMLFLAAVEDACSDKEETGPMQSIFQNLRLALRVIVEFPKTLR